MERVPAASALVALALVMALGCAALSGASDLRTSAELDDAGAAPEASAPAPTPDAGSKACPKGTKRCDDSCVDVMDPAFGCGSPTCNRCSVPFAATVKCVAGACAVTTCSPGRADCNGRADDGCEADLTLPATCGSCAVACPVGNVCAFGTGGCLTACPSATTQCGSSCIDVQTSITHCGGCITVCPSTTNAVPSCNAGHCGITCNTGFAECDGDTANGCEAKVAYYTDADRDGHGAKGSVKVGEACAPPLGFVTVADDCNDGNQSVYPGQMQYFDTPYTMAGVSSFDYDCSGVEDLNPGQPIGNCGPPCFNGFVKDVATNSYCGSNQRVKGCLPTCNLTTGAEQFRCH